MIMTRRFLSLGAFALAGCETSSTAARVPEAAGAPLSLGLVLFSLDFVAGKNTGLPARTQITLVLGEEAQRTAASPGGRIARTMAGPGRLSGHDLADGERSVARLYAINLPARPYAIGRIFVEPTDSVLTRTNYLLPPLPFTPAPGRALYLGNIAILPHTWSPTREPNVQPSSHRALRDMTTRDLPLLLERMPGLAGMPVETLPRPAGWPPALPPRVAWPDGSLAVRAGEGVSAPPYYGPPGRQLAPPGTPVRQLGQPAPPPGFGPPGVAPGRFGRGAAQ